MRRLLLVVLAAVLLPACGGEEAADEPAPNGAGGGDAIEIALTDFALEPAALELDPGTVTLRVVNEGATTHALEVDGMSLEEETGDLAPGESTELVVELVEGEYELYCPVGDHRGRGMEGTLTVGSGGAGGGDTTTGETTTEDSGYRY
jgi:uncharacterized cupredoxin-like copper-binding protein